MIVAITLRAMDCGLDMNTRHGCVKLSTVLPIYTMFSRYGIMTCLGALPVHDAGSGL